MNVILFGATGMVGQGALREAILDPQVTRIVSILRRASPPVAAPAGGLDRSRVHEVVHPDMTSFAAIESELTDLDACLYCLGVTSAGLSRRRTPASPTTSPWRRPRRWRGSIRR
jgi:uncharacterized protein YbjT (DUF2867 family)